VALQLLKEISLFVCADHGLYLNHRPLRKKTRAKSMLVLRYTEMFRDLDVKIF